MCSVKSRRPDTGTLHLHVSEGQQWPQDKHEDHLGVRVTVSGCLGCNLHENLSGYQHNDLLPPFVVILLHVAVRHHKGSHKVCLGGE
jgi:hypothetical protein